MHKPPGSRPLLEKAIAEQYRKSRESQWLGFQSDELLAWLRETVAGISIEKNRESELENRIAKYLSDQDRIPETSVQELPVAALRSTPEHGHTAGNLPDEEVTQRVKATLEHLDREEGRGNEGITG